MVYSNNKPRFSRDIKTHWRETNAAFKSGIKDLNRTAKYNFGKASKETKRHYRAKLENKPSSKDSKELWQVFQSMTNYKVKHVCLDSDPNLPEESNNFYCRF